eukprot:6627265-Lingulodinium_polyedra.AAC.1
MPCLMRAGGKRAPDAAPRALNGLGMPRPCATKDELVGGVLVCGAHDRIPDLLTRAHHGLHAGSR